MVRSTEEMAELEPTFNQHQAVTGRPFTATYLSLDKTYNALDQTSKDAINAIDEYIASKIGSGQYKDSAETATELIRELEKKINLKDYHDPYYRAEKLAHYISNLDKYEKQKTVKARITKETLTQHKAQTNTFKNVARKVDQISDLPSTVEKQIDKITNETRRLAKESSNKEAITDLATQVSRVGRQIPRATSEISEQIGELISFNKQALKEVSKISRKTERALSLAERQSKKTIETKEAITKILDTL